MVLFGTPFPVDLNDFCYFAGENKAFVFIFILDFLCLQLWGPVWDVIHIFSQKHDLGEQSCLARLVVSPPNFPPRWGARSTVQPRDIYLDENSFVRCVRRSRTKSAPVCDPRRNFVGWEHGTSGFRIPMYSEANMWSTVSSLRWLCSVYGQQYG